MQAKTLRQMPKGCRQRAVMARRPKAAKNKYKKQKLEIVDQDHILGLVGLELPTSASWVNQPIESVRPLS